MPAPNPGPVTAAQLVAYYQNLLIIQYKNSVKAFQTIGALSTQVVASNIYQQVQAGFDVTTAIGNQLDLLGAYVGAHRFLANFSSSNQFMAFPLYANPNANTVVGFSQYTDLTPPMGYWLLYTTQGTSYVLSDGQLRDLIQYLIAVHASDHTNKSIDLILEQFFGSYVTLTDGGNMTLTYTHNATLDPFQLFAVVNYLNALPHPAGVQINVVTI
jgi:hypothetical protein